MENWIVGNWKMNGSQPRLAAFLPELAGGLPGDLGERGVRVAICPPAPYLSAAGQAMAGTAVELGAQRVHPAQSGAFTGEVSPPMLKEMGVVLCLVAHSEQRQFFGETNASAAEKIHALLAEGITPIYCVGETLEEREAGREQEVIRGQLAEALRSSEDRATAKRRSDAVQTPHGVLSGGQAASIILAYEPVWAIGTGKTATPDQAEEMHRFIRTVLKESFHSSLADSVPILYGGSVNPGNAGVLLAQPNINGALVGGASLKAQDFLVIINSAVDTPAQD